MTVWMAHGHLWVHHSHSEQEWLPGNCLLHTCRSEVVSGQLRVLGVRERQALGAEPEAPLWKVLPDPLAHIKTKQSTSWNSIIPKIRVIPSVKRLFYQYLKVNFDQQCVW